MNHEILIQKAILVLGFISGYYLIICSPINYYGLISTGLLVLTFTGGLFANHLNNGSKKHNSFFPTVSIVIPAKDEEKHIYQTIEKYTKVNYPPDKLEVIVVNDGSTDGTWLEIKRAIKDFSDTLKIKGNSFRINRGKRKALAHGIRCSSGEIIVTTDSDTFVRRNALIPLMQPLLDKRVAGVTGQTYVRNKRANLLTRMQASLYFYAYRVGRSFESMFGSVLCLPGTLSAFRKQYVLELLDEWENAKPFVGEDRHLTYLLLRAGYKTMFVKESECETFVPEKLKPYLSQQLRWAKGYLIETFRGCRYMVKKHPVIAIVYYLQYLLTLYVSLAIMRIFVLLLTNSPYWWDYFLFVGVTLLLKSVYCHVFSKDKCSWAINLFLFINLLMNAWRIPVALLTLSENTRWTR